MPFNFDICPLVSHPITAGPTAGKYGAPEGTELKKKKIKIIKIGRAAWRESGAQPLYNSALPIH